MDRAFNKLEAGFMRADVLEKMGRAPNLTNTTFTLGQRNGYESEYAKTNGLKIALFYTWVNGIDHYYCVGFNDEDKLVVKGQGGT